MNILRSSEDIKTRFLDYKTTLIQGKHNLQKKQKRLLSIFDNAKEDFDNNKIESAVADIKREILYQKSRESAIKSNIDYYIKQEDYKRKHKFTTWLKLCIFPTWLKSCIVKPFPTWIDDPGEIVCILCGIIMGWFCRITAFGADSRWGVMAIFMFGCILAFSFSIPSAVKAFCCKNGNKFGVFYFVAELIMLIGSIIWFCLY